MTPTEQMRAALTAAREWVFAHWRSDDRDAMIAQINAALALPAGEADPLHELDQYNFEGWNGADAAPITPETFAAARALLNELPNVHCAPGADGTIGFEWQPNEGPLKKLFIDIGPADKFSAYVRLRDDRKFTVPPKATAVSDEAVEGLRAALKDMLSVTDVGAHDSYAIYRACERARAALQAAAGGK